MFEMCRQTLCSKSHAAIIDARARHLLCGIILFVAFGDKDISRADYI